MGSAVKGASTGQCTENLWRCAGIVGIPDFQRSSTTSILPTMICILGSYFHMHICWGSLRSRNEPLRQVLGVANIPSSLWSGTNSAVVNRALACEVSIANRGILAFEGWARHHLCVLRGATSIAWVGHQIHMSSFRMRILDSGTTPYVIPTPSDLFRQENIFSSVLDDSTVGPLRGAVLSGIAHHFYVGIAFLGSSFPCCLIPTSSALKSRNEVRRAYQKANSAVRVVIPTSIFKQEGSFLDLRGSCLCPWVPILSINLATAGQLSIRFADNYAVIAIYPNIAKDSGSALSLFYHHVGIGGLSVIGASASASIRWIRDRRF